MDKYYGNVCELDIIFNFQKAYFILDELLLAGEMQESSKKNVLRCIGQQDSLEDMEVCSSRFPGYDQQNVWFQQPRIWSKVFFQLSFDVFLIFVSHIPTLTMCSAIRSKMMVLPRLAEISCTYFGCT